MTIVAQEQRATQKDQQQVRKGACDSTGWLEEPKVTQDGRVYHFYYFNNNVKISENHAQLTKRNQSKNKTIEPFLFLESQKQTEQSRTHYNRQQKFTYIHFSIYLLTV